MSDKDFMEAGYDGPNYDKHSEGIDKLRKLAPQLAPQNTTKLAPQLNDRKMSHRVS